MGNYNIGTSIRNGASITTVSNGNITINGTSGAGNDRNYGLEIVSGGAVVSSENGDITINTISNSTTGIFNLGSLIGAECYHKCNRNW